MRIACLSDLHLEFYAAGQLQTGGGPVGTWHVERIAAEADAVVLAGDIHKGAAGVAWAANRFPRELPVVYVLGNHEFYGGEVQDVYRQCRTRARGTNVHVLEGETTTLAGVRFLGTTLWTDFAANGTPALSEARVGEALNDFRRIRYGAEPLQTATTCQWHDRARQWLAARLAEGPAVVVTHHGPHMATQPPCYRYGELAPGFTSDCSELFGPGVPLWICGHTHHCCDFEVAGTRIVVNQAGYPHEPVPGFDPIRILEVAI